MILFVKEGADRLLDNRWQHISCSRSAVPSVSRRMEKNLLPLDELMMLIANFLPVFLQRLCRAGIAWSHRQLVHPPVNQSDKVA